MASKGREGHLERTAGEPRDADLHEVRLSRIDQFNERVRLFRLDLVAGPIKFLPGQWLDTYIPGVSKAGGFTITSAPSAALANTSPYLELAVQESPENEPAAWLWRSEREILGETLRVRVGGKFVFPPVEGAPKKVVFVAGGVGVNPLVSMLSYIAEGGGQGVGDVRFIYASKLPRSGKLSDIVFLDRITSLFGEGKVKGEVKLFVTAAGNAISQETTSINGAQVEVRPRRLTMADVEAAIGDRLDQGTVVYVCGPPTMTDELVEKLAVIVDPQRVLTERWW
ncbi:hypothetical protein M431DRAFT_93578 [Trichoderma harzianum CBS 226.95]|uniref:Oxidoreductase NAD-binding domain-containing protein 1 n=1 Tax=Trichoderma harzianum CBS 226.95 TaxID=983964 RepID=A0A2T4A1W5_TRIHA|nr:hypothetical protein M431DRAFT_93578 [Trichoderma harzianum CBS 226.95]PTB51056.1 hypothetical protein M431DRAFT_93578 [Trichoderma harzianum CBS 226.95]